jgi:hypothetical protein
VSEWVASLAKEELARDARLAAAIERVPPTEGALEFAERLALSARDSSTRTRVHDVSPLSPDSQSSVTPPTATASVVAATPAAPRSRRLAVALALAALAGVARLVIRRCFAAYSRAFAAPVLSCMTSAGWPSSERPRRGVENEA